MSIIATQGFGNERVKKTAEAIKDLLFVYCFPPHPVYCRKCKEVLEKGIVTGGVIKYLK